jgi:prevent-host-death family protein
VISATVLRTKTRDILEEARYGGEHFIVETFGKPMAAIVGVEEYWKLTGKETDQIPDDLQD